MAKPLSNRGRAQLQGLLRYRDREMTPRSLLWDGRRGLARFFVFCAVVTALCAWVVGPELVPTVLVVFITVLVRDLTYLRAAVRNWSVTRSVIDWPLVESRLAGSDAPTCAATTAPDELRSE